MINIGHETYHSHVENDLPRSFIHMQILHKPTRDNVSPKVRINYLRQGFQYITCSFCSWNWRNTWYTRENKLDFNWYQTIVFTEKFHLSNQSRKNRTWWNPYKLYFECRQSCCVTTLIVNPRKMLWRNSMNSASTSVFYGLQTPGYILCSFLLEDMSQPTSLYCAWILDL